MAKRIKIDGKFYRYRRGKLVRIPDAWVGCITTSQTISKRRSKGTRKEKMRVSVSRPFRKGHPNTQPPRHIGNRANERSSAFRECENWPHFQCAERNIDPCKVCVP